MLIRVPYPSQSSYAGELLFLRLTAGMTCNTTATILAKSVSQVRRHRPRSRAPFHARLDTSTVIFALHDLSEGAQTKSSIVSLAICSLVLVWPLDLSSYASIKAIACRTSTETRRIDAIVLNTGVTPETSCSTEALSRPPSDLFRWVG